MKRSQRTAHAAVWPTLTIGMLLVLVLALMAREHTTPSPPPSPAQEAR
jgi:hypothetical protein